MLTLTPQSAVPDPCPAMAKKKNVFVSAGILLHIIMFCNVNNEKYTKTIKGVRLLTEIS